MPVSTPTVSDCLEHARSALDDEARAQHLHRGEQLAQSDSDWRQLAKAYVESGDRDTARRCLDAAIAHDPQQTWCFADKAHLLCESFDDRAGASAVLRECQANLEAEPDGPGYRWSLLAGHILTIVGDAEAARACLDVGTERARSLDDLCSMAQAYGARLGDVARARSLLQRAERMAREDAKNTPQTLHGHWTLANTYSGIGDNEAARRVLTEGLELASSVEACVTLARAWSSQKAGQPSVLGCLQRAESLARSPQSWLSIAEAYHEHTTAASACRQALERACEGAHSTELRRVAFGFAHWVGDEARARALAPRGVRPQDLSIRRKPLEGWHGNAGALLTLLLEAVTDEALDAIADADYGYGRADNRAALEDMRGDGLVPIPMVSTLHEVMALTQWSDGERVDHVERALACTLLCLDVLHDDAFTEDITATLAPLVESCWKLGPDHQRALAAFLVWLVETMRGAEEQWWEDNPDDGEDLADEDLDSGNALAALHALLLTQLVLEPADPRLDALCVSVVTLEKRMSEWSAPIDDEAPWMSRVLRSIRDEMWPRLAAEALAEAERHAPQSLAVRTLRPLLE